MTSSADGLRTLSEREREIVEALLAEFGRAWHEKLLLSYVRKLPPAGSPLRRVALVELVKLDLRRQWAAGRHLRLEAYLSALPELGTPETVSSELILAEYEARRQGGKPATLTRLAERFPRQAEELRRLAASSPPAGAGQASVQTGGPPDTAHGGRPAAEPSLPEQFGRYRILTKLGRGGMGTVYLAHDTQLGRRVALKVPHFTAEHEPVARERFYREARAAATLNHPNLCPVYDVGEVGGTHYLTMAYVEGQPLSDLLRGGKPLAPRQAALLVTKLAAALGEAHRHGIVHRDLKPSNVMINERKEPVVMDFGLARCTAAVEPLTRSGELLGTPAYMAPEQVEGKPVGPASDVYSLGVILYELLTGRRPFEGTVAEVLGRILTQDPPRPSLHRPGLDPALEAICCKAMAKKPENRYASMGDLAASLTVYLQASGVAARPRDGHAGGGQPQRRRRWSLAALAGVLVLGVLLGVVLFIRTGKGTVRIEVDDPRAVVEVDGDVIRVEQLGEPLTLRPGEHTLLVRYGDVELESREVTIRRGSNSAQRFTIKAKLEQAARADKGPGAGPAPAPARRPGPADGLPREVVNSIGMNLVLIPPGEYDMGSHESPQELVKAFPGSNEQFYLPEYPRRRMRIARPFYLGAYEVTQGEYQQVMGTNPSAFSPGGANRADVPGLDTRRFPVDSVTWPAAVAFCRKLSERPEERRAGRAYRLPSEVEWEYACRGGSAQPSRYGFGDSPLELEAYAWLLRNSRGRAHAVGTRKPNGFGLYDLHGNVGELCSDLLLWREDGTGPAEEKKGEPPGRVLRGGAWGAGPGVCRTSHRLLLRGSFTTTHYVGFRVVMIPDRGADKPPATAENDPRVSVARAAYEAEVQKHDRKQLEADGGEAWQKVAAAVAAAEEAARKGDARTAADKYREAKQLLPEAVRLARMPQIKTAAWRAGYNYVPWVGNRVLFNKARTEQQKENAKRFVEQGRGYLRQNFAELEVPRDLAEPLLDEVDVDKCKLAWLTVNEQLERKWGKEVRFSVEVGSQCNVLLVGLFAELRQPGSSRATIEQALGLARAAASAAGHPKAMFDALDAVEAKVKAGLSREALAVLTGLFRRLNNLNLGPSFFRQSRAAPPGP